MRRLCVLSAVLLVISSGFFVGCRRPAKNDDPQPVDIDPGKVNIGPAIDNKIDPPKKQIVKTDDTQDKYEAALGDALGALAARKWNDALSAFKTAQKLQNTEFVRSEIAK